jgi:hypothetical protein
MENGQGRKESEIAKGNRTLFIPGQTILQVIATEELSCWLAATEELRCGRYN